ncbi:MAG TPA: GAF domain-containing sensor histidine kinase [Methylomirabilota bacterium]|nr:GAF domain-containing sensor histidine kinase [Methylomirabilota bacterium]
MFKKFISLLSPKTTSPSNDAEHINQEMYKKGAELAERNKTLSLLQKINEIILNSITHANEIAQLVTSLLVNEAGFEIVALFLHDKEQKVLKRIAFSETSKNISIPYLTELSLTQTENLLIQAVNDLTKKSSTTLENVLLSKEILANSPIQQALQQVKSVFVFPLIVRGELIGVMVIALADEEQKISEYTRDLINRLVEIIGIALDNSLLYNEVQSQNIRLQELDRLKDEFVSVASHELRTPMTAIKSYLWMSLDGRGGELTEKQKFYLQRAYNSSDRLIRLVSDMLNVSRIDSGRITIEVGAVAMEQLVQEVFDEVMPHAQELGVMLQLNKVESLPPVLADSDKIKEVLFNLIGNSLKFTPKDGTVTVSFAQKGDMVETTVKDTGTGIAPEDISKLFQKFGLVAGSYISDRSIQGTGLGLYISRSIIQLHGGTITVASEGRGKGAMFVFTLPVYHEESARKVATNASEKDEQTVGIIHTEM